MTKVLALSSDGKKLYWRDATTPGSAWAEFGTQPPIVGNGGLLLATEDEDIVVYDDGGVPWDENVIDSVVTPYSFDITNDYAVVGVVASEQFRVYQRADPNTWTWLRTVNNPNAPALDQFGTSVSMSGDTIVVYAPLFNDGVHTGAIYIYRDYGATLEQTILLDSIGPPPPWLTVRVGGLVGVIGDRLLIWVVWSNMFDHSHTISVYDRVAGVWTATTTLIAGAWIYNEGVITDDWDGTKYIELHTTVGGYRATIYSAAWAQEITVSPTVGYTLESVAINGDIAVVAERKAAHWHEHTVRIFEYALGAWSETATLPFTSPASSTALQTAVTSEGFVLIGDYGAGAASGIRVYTNPAGVWSLYTTLITHTGTGKLSTFVDGSGYFVGAYRAGASPAKALCFYNLANAPEIGFWHYSHATLTWSFKTYGTGIDSAYYYLKGCMLALDDIYVAVLDTSSAKAAILHYDGVAWTEYVDLTALWDPITSWIEVWGIWAANGNAIWAVGYNTVLQWTGGAWVDHRAAIEVLLGWSVDDIYINDVQGVSEDSVYVSCSGYTPAWDFYTAVVHWNGATWTQIGNQIVNNGASWSQLSVASDTDIWMATYPDSDELGVYRWDGAATWVEKLHLVSEYAPNWRGASSTASCRFLATAGDYAFSPLASPWPPTVPELHESEDAGASWADAVWPDGNLIDAVCFYGGAVVALGFRTPLGALYIDELRDLTVGTGILLINCVPEANETDVAHDALLHMRIVSLDNVALNATTKVYITRSSDQTRRLAYDQAAGGFQAPYNGALSLATAQASPGSGVDDELILCIDGTAAFTSLETLFVEVYADSALPATLYDSYSFTIEDLTAPHIDEILWLTPRRCRLKWAEPVDQSTTPHGALFVEDCLGGVEIVPETAANGQGSRSTTVRLGSLTPRTTWIGHYLNLANSAYPENHKPRPILSVSATERTVTVDCTGSYGYMRADDGNDWDDTNRTDYLEKGSTILVRQRKLQASVSPYWLTARLSAEGASSPSYSPEKVQCAFCPVAIAASQPTADELPAGEDPDQYTYIDWHDDVSFGRLYTIHADGVADAYGNACTDAQLDHQTPWFGAPTDRIKMWSNGFIAPLSRTDDLQHDQLLRKLVVVLQDVLNSLWHRVDQLQFIRDPGLCPDELVDFLLYEVGNPFRFALTTAQKRLLVSALPELYKRIGTEQGIEDFLFRLLNIKFEITPYVEGDFWTLGVDKLNLTTMLGPGTARARNSYEIFSPVTLTDDEERIVTDVAEWADPYNMHLSRIVQPGDTPGPGGGYWVLNVSALGVSTMLSGS